MEERITITKKDFDKANAEKKKKWDKDYLKNLEKTNLETMVKPVKPIYPDYKKFPREQIGKKDDIEKSPYLLALEKYYKEMPQYELNIALWEQIKLMKDIQRSNLKLCLKKYKVNKQ
jgi:hypothetical protein